MPAKYLSLSDEEFKLRITNLYNRLKSCTICPRKCRKNRIQNELGTCGIGLNPKISSYNLHFGEEPPLSGTRGSGTIFFTRCNLHCVFCQNYPISQLGYGEEIAVDQIAKIMLTLQTQGAHNINFVTPTHVVPQLVQAIYYARKQGLNLPLVYNSGGYESVETLKLLDDVIDIYMPDMKYAEPSTAVKYSSAPDYPQINRMAIKEMYRQVGDLKIDTNGIAERGLLIRHLVLPENIAGSQNIFDFIVHEIGVNTYMSVMAQYHPAHRAYEYTELSRRITPTEYETILNYCDQSGLTQGWRQEL